MNNDFQDLVGKTILVTGSSRGIGLTTAKLLLKRGARVVFHSRSNHAEVEKIINENQEQAKCVLGDLSDENGANTVWEQAIAAFGHIDVLVNNAGAWLPSDIHSRQAWQDGWTRNIGLNLAAPAELCRLAILHFQTRGGGIIVNITSRSAHRGDDAQHLAYGAAKGGLLALTKGIARGYGRDNILAYAIAPGWVATELAAGAIEPSVLANLPLGEVTPADDVAEVVAFLATGRSRHSTGATFDITGADYVR